MDGILLVLKPPDMTSFDVVAWVRRVTGVKKIGHAGTLDPAASGLLPLCIGKATKAIEQFQQLDKSYRAEMILGVVTNTQDAEGEMIEKKPVHIQEKEILACLSAFTGEILQIPPMFSAVKINGKRLYDLARQGVEIERKGRKVVISYINLLSIQMNGEYPVVRFDVSCSKGTYIRTLCHDIGQALGCGAHMSFLVRTRIGAFLLDQAVLLEEIEQHQTKGSLSSLLLPVDILFENYRSVIIDEIGYKKFINGASVAIKTDLPFKGGENVRVYSYDSFLGTGIVQTDQAISIKPVKLYHIPNH